MDMNALVEAALLQANEAIAANNVLANRIKSAGNQNALIAEVRDSAETTDETILEYRAQMDKVNNLILGWQKDVEEYIRTSGLVDLGDIDVEAATKEWKANADTIKAAKSLLKTVGGDEAVAKLTEVVGIPGTRTGGGGSTGQRRPRFQDIAYRVAGSEDWKPVSKTEGEGADAKTVTNLTLLAQTLATKDHKVTAADLQQPLFKVAGTEDLSSLEGTPVEFVFTVGDVNYEVKVTPGTKSE